MIFAILGNILVLLGPLLTGKAIDYMKGLGKVEFKSLIQLLVVLFVLYVLGSLFQWFMTIFSTKIAYNTVKDIRRDAFSKLEKLPLKYFDQTMHGDILSRLTNDIDAISEGVFQGTMQFISGFVVIVGCFLFMLTISIRLTLVILLITPICFLIAKNIAKGCSKMFRLQSETVGALNGYTEEMIGNLKVVKAFGYETSAMKEFAEKNQKLYECGQKAQFYSSLTNPTTRYVNNLAYVAVCVIGGMMSIKGGFSVGNITSFLTYSTQFAKPINEMTSITTQLQAALASAKRIFQFLDETEEEIGENKMLPDKIKGEVAFKQVAFAYEKETPLIKNFNLQVKEGSMIAIVGPTGAGKSTLVNLLMRFYDVDNGSIKVEGQDIRILSRDSLRSKIGMVLQETWLFKGTVKENIAYSKPEATEEEIIAAAKKAYAHGFIKKLKHGYDTMIEEDGKNLSQGQRQLLTIARVMLMDPPMLVLDEATSSIDTRTELKIQAAFANIMKGRTSFIIAHRLSTIKDADVILVLNNGDIVEQGSHQELLDKKGFYYELYQSSFAGQEK